jgi:predicted transcriptional regulator
MAKVRGAQRLILQAIMDLSKDSADYVTDAQIAQHTQLALGQVRNWIQTLDWFSTVYSRISL